MMRKMWLGTKQFARWVKVHSPGSGYDNAGYSERLDYLNGGVGLRGSWASHGERTLTWNRVTAEEAREIADFADGIYGNGPFYLIDPVSATQNVLDKQWATPALTGKDGVPLIGFERPTLVRNYDMRRGYPTEMARYEYGDVGGSRTAYVPIPPGHVAWVGVHGDPASTGGLEVQPTSGEFSSGPATTVPVTAVDDPLFSHSFPASSDQAGIELTFRHGESVTNLFTNPNFVAGSGTVEVYRNILNPAKQDGGSWLTSGATITGAGVRTITVTSANGWWQSDGYGTAGFYNVGMVAGGTYTIKHKSSATNLQAQLVYYDGAQKVLAADADGVLTVPANALGGGSIRFVSPTVQTITFSAPTVLVGAVRSGPAFTSTISSDPDLTPSAVTDASILSGVPVAGVAATRCVAIRSSKFGGSMRLIPTDLSNNTSFARFAVPTGAVRTLGTAIATSRLEAPLTGPLRAQAMSLDAASPEQYQARPNVAGTFDHRLVFSSLASDYGLYFYHGGTVGSGDVYWTMGGLFEGDYTGPWFDGNTPGASWDGAPNASTSTLSTTTVTLAGIIVQIHPAGVTPEDGKFVSGQGMTGFQFEGKPQITPYSIAHDSFGLSAKIVETE